LELGVKRLDIPFRKNPLEASLELMAFGQIWIGFQQGPHFFFGGLAQMAMGP
jgi:hypothetical protein